MDALLSCFYQNNENSNKRDLDIANVKLINREVYTRNNVYYTRLFFSLKDKFDNKLLDRTDVGYWPFLVDRRW